MRFFHINFDIRLYNGSTEGIQLTNISPKCTIVTDTKWLVSTFFISDVNITIVSKILAESRPFRFMMSRTKQQLNLMTPEKIPKSHFYSQYYRNGATFLLIKL